MTTRTRLLAVLDGTLNLGGRSSSFTDDTPLMGSIPELDSMGVVALLTALEDQFGFSVEDDEIDGSVFETFGKGKLFGSFDASEATRPVPSGTRVVWR